jgi:hypothetical protein
LSKEEESASQELLGNVEASDGNEDGKDEGREGAENSEEDVHDENKDPDDELEGDLQLAWEVLDVN